MGSVRGVELAAGAPGAPLLVVGPSLGTGVEALWSDAVAALGDRFRVIGWDLPGHGVSPEPTGGVTFEALAADVRALAGEAANGAPWWYAGVSAGGAVGLQLLVEGGPAGAVLISTGARIGVPQAWLERASVVDTMGTPSQVEASARRWFAPGFIERRPQAVTRLLATLQTAGAAGYSGVCRALADFDVTDRLAQIGVPVIALAGDHDEPTPVSSLALLASRIPNARLRVLEGVAHLAPVEAPDEVAAAIESLVAEGTGAAFGAGLAVRREVLGSEHVARATEGTTALTSPFQSFITEYAWGSVWTRPGLERRMRSAVTLTALVAGGHWEELPMHLRAARRNGLSVIEIREILLQCAVYCSVPSANHAFAIAGEVLAEAEPASGADGEF